VSKEVALINLASSTEHPKQSFHAGMKSLARMLPREWLALEQQDS
jgi:hypothetical protein